MRRRIGNRRIGRIDIRDEIEQPLRLIGFHRTNSFYLWPVCERFAECTPCVAYVLDLPWRPDNPCEQIRRINSHRLAQPDEDHDGWLAFPSFDVVDVLAGDFGLSGKLLLRQSCCEPSFSYFLP